MAEDALFAGIDIGSTAVRIAVGQRLPSNDREQVHIVGAAEVPSEGINRGVINSIEDAVSSVSACIERVERMTGSPVQSAWISISGSNVTLLESKGVVAVAKSDGEIREDDVARVVDQAQTVSAPVNYEIIHVIPKSFTVDGQKGIKDPVSMNGLRLEVDAQIIQGLSSHIKNLTKCVYRTGVNIESLVLGVLATAEVVTTARQKELGVAVVNIGGSTTNLVVFEQGDILHMASIPLGSDHITSDIAIGLRTSIDVAERVKLQHAEAVAAGIPRNEQINLRELGATEDELVSRKYVCDIVQARLEEIMERIEKEFKKVGRSGMLPAGVVLTGGGAKIAGIVDLAKQKLRLPASLGYPIGVTSITDRVNDLAFTTSIGLVQWGLHETPEGAKKRKSGGFGKPVEKVGQTIKKWFGALVP
ncbi:MAG TPA: cell division protein FtsA [Candidatus Binatia bacterium]|jgi:cell division protein FtsA|nr:cell division protein FtsA [Candidatus Binatia bacterium]